MRIQALRPRVGFDLASERLFRTGWRRFFRLVRKGTLAEFYVPYFVFTVEAELTGQRDRSFWAIDGREGNLDAIPLQHRPKRSELVELETSNCLDFVLDEARARTILQQQLRHLYQSRRGDAALRQFNLTIAVPALRLHWPFWVASIEHSSKPQIEALDAISGDAQSQRWKEMMLGGRRVRPTPEVGRRR